MTKQKELKLKRALVRGMSRLEKVISN